MVYLPKNAGKAGLKVIIWLHGWAVGDYKTNIFGKDEAGGNNQLREGVDAAGRDDVVLIAPWLGEVHSVPDPTPKDPKHTKASGAETVGKIANNVDAYLDEILGLLAPRLGKATLKSADIDQLVIACHSGGGEVMRPLANMLNPKTLGPKLVECWGFDCMYSSGDVYAAWADALPGKLGSSTAFYFYLAEGTLGYWGNFTTLWQFAYGTPLKPDCQRMHNIYMAPALKLPVALDTLTDTEVFESYDFIASKQWNLQKQQPPGKLTDYEGFRLSLDLSLDGKTVDGKKATQTWGQLVSGKLKDHYGCVQDMLAPRIKGLAVSAKAITGQNGLAQVCKKQGMSWSEDSCRTLPAGTGRMARW
jgi:hypothetical protein